MISRLHPRSSQSLDRVVLQEATVLRLEPQHLAGHVVEGPGEAGTIVSTGLGALLPVRDRGLGAEKGSVSTGIIRNDNHRVGNISLASISEDDLVLRWAPEVSRVAAGEKLQLLLR